MSQATDTGIGLLHGMPAIADAMGLTPRQIRNLMEAEGLPTFRIGRTVCARPERIRRWLEKLEERQMTRASELRACIPHPKRLQGTPAIARYLGIDPSAPGWGVLLSKIPMINQNDASPAVVTAWLRTSKGRRAMARFWAASHLAQFPRTMARLHQSEIQEASHGHRS